MKKVTLYQQIELHFFEDSNPRPRLLYFDSVSDLENFLRRNKKRIKIIEVLRTRIEVVRPSDILPSD